MNRRSFFKTLAAATAGFTILPPATTYQRIWKAQTQIVNPEYVNAHFDPIQYIGDWKWLNDPLLIKRHPDGRFSFLKEWPVGKFPPLTS